MMMDDYADEDNGMDFFSPMGDGNDSIPDMPCFECSNADDRPLAPDAEEYPLNCEVELRDRDFALKAQEESRWEPFLDEVFSVPRRRVTVVRHYEDYTFVMCYGVKGYEKVGFTLYRACLSEPKVKTTKYYANIAAAREEDDDLARDTRLTNDSRQDEFSLEDAFDRPIGPGTVASKSFGTSPPFTAPPSTGFSSNGKAVNFVEELERRQQLDLYATNDAPPRVAQPPAAEGAAASPAVPPAGSGGEGADGNPVLANTTESSAVTVSGHPRMTTSKVEQVRRRNKFASLMKRGTEELNKGNYELSLGFYNSALTEAPEEEARILSSRSVAYLLFNRTDLALQDAKRVITLAPESFLGYLRTANVLRGMKQYNDAQSYYKDALKRNSENSTIRKLLLSNSVSMLYDARTKRFQQVKMIFDASNTRVLSIARKGINKDDYVLKETTPTSAVFSCQYSHVLSGARKTWMCHNCGRPFLDEEDLCSRIPGMRPEIFRTLCREPKPVRCNYNCHSMYCSDDCRSKAWAFHHWVECGTRGRWREGVNAVHAYLDEYIDQTPVPAGSAQSGGSVVEDMSPMVIATSVRIAVRMFSRMLSCVWALRDAVHMYDWIQVSPIVDAQSETVRPVLQESYRLLSDNFKSEEKPKLSFELFERCYKRVKSNSVTLRVSSWSKLALRAEGLMNFVDADAPAFMQSRPPKSSSPDSTQGSAPAQSSVTGADNSRLSSHSGVASSSLTEEQKRALEFILAAPPEGIPGTHFIILALFEIYASMAPTNMAVVRQPYPSGAPTGRPSSGKDIAEAQAAARPPPPPPNLAIHGILESNVCLHVRATRAIRRGETLVSAPPVFIPPITK